MKLQNPIYVFPSEKAAERRRREMFAASAETVCLGEQVFSLPHFLQTLSDPLRPILKRQTQKHLIAHGLRQTPLRHFEKLKKFPSLAQTFLDGIRCLKRWAITPETLEEILKETGSLKEYDLLLIYKKYEAEKEKLGWLDEEDLCFAQPKAPPKTDKIIFADFAEKPKALEKLLHQLSAEWRPLPDIEPKDLARVQLYSLPTPFAEANWFCRRLAALFKQGVKPSEIGIVGDGNSLELEACWQKLKNLGLAQGPSPFLTLEELAPGRNLLARAAAIPKEEAPLEEWLDLLVGDCEPLKTLAFQDFVLPFGNLKKSEWLAWAAEALKEKPEIKIGERLNGLQWLDLDEGDFPSLKFLWVPFLTEGRFPKITPSVFFADPKDRSRKEWKNLCAAFPDAPTLFAQKQRKFLYALSKSREAVWLTFSRLDSLGSDLSPSPFTWDFGEAEAVSRVEAIAQGEGGTFAQKLQVERERMTDQLASGDFHAQLDAEKWREKVAPMQANHIFSPSQLEKYAQCPFKYFANRIWGIPEQKECAPELDPDDRGTLFHDGMELFMKENRELVVAARKDPALEPGLFAKLDGTMEAVFEQSKENFPYRHPELYEQLKQKTIHQARLVLQKELEEARGVAAPLEPAHFEWTFGKGNHPPCEMETLRLGGRIDRIDIDPQSGRFLVVDYKTGHVNGFQNRLLEGLSFQLPLYILAVRKLLLQKGQTVGGLLVETRQAKKKTGLVDDAFNQIHFQIHKSSHSLMNREKLEAAIAQAAQWAADYVQKIRAGYFSPQPKECLSICDYKEICRYAGKPFV